MYAQGKYFLRAHEHDEHGKPTSFAVCFHDGEMVFEVEGSVYSVAENGFFMAQHMARHHADKLNKEEDSNT